MMTIQRDADIPVPPGFLYFAGSNSESGYGHFGQNLDTINVSVRKYANDSNFTPTVAIIT